MTTSPPPPTRRQVFGRGSYTDARFVAEVLRAETVGGLLLLGATVIALVWVNTPLGDAYVALRDFELGPTLLRAHLTVAEWTADGLLAIFFFVAGLELKREFVAGELRDPRRAAMPVAAAVGGMAAPALIYVLWNLDTGGDALRGWAIPTATDIAFALAVLAVISTHLPTALRTFLLTLAVVDDLLAIMIIAIFYTSDLQVVPLLLAIVPVAIFGVLVQRRITSWWLLLPLALAAWLLVHASGVHATVAGVLLGFTVPALVNRRDHTRAEAKAARTPKVSAAGHTDGSAGHDVHSLAEHLEHVWRPISSGVAVPLFALFAAGVAIGGISGLTESLSDPVAQGIAVALVVGKIVGVLGSAALVARFTKAQLADDLSWWDVLGVSMLAGIGFTVSLLIGELAFGHGSERDEHVKIGVLLGSVVAALVATVMLRARNRTYRRIWEEEIADSDGDGIPDVYQGGGQQA